MNQQKITITKSSLYFRECKACGCVTLHIGKTAPEMTPGSMYNDCLQCLVDAHSVPGLSRWIDPKTGKTLTEPRGKTDAASGEKLNYKGLLYSSDSKDYLSSELFGNPEQLDSAEIIQEKPE